MIELTTEQWDLYLKKYKNLMWRISHLISGDAMIASIEDNFFDLNIAAIESIHGYHMNLISYKQYVKTKLVKEGVYNVYFADTHVFLGNFRYREVSNLYTYEPPEYWDYTGDWDEDTLIAIGLHLKDLNLQCANKAKETRVYD